MGWDADILAPNANREKPPTLFASLDPGGSGVESRRGPKRPRGTRATPEVPVARGGDTVFFFIAGVRSRVRATGRNRVGRCSRCGGDQVFEAVRIRPYVEFFFLPLFPVGRGEQAWRCTSCQALRAGATTNDAGSGRSVPGRSVSSRSWRGDGTEPSGGSDLEAALRWAGGSASGSTRDSTLGTRQSVAPRYCHHCGTRIEASPSEGRTAGFRRYHCASCGRDFEVGG